jgi:hypothetical protein
MTDLRTAPQWQAYVESGATIQDRRARLAEITDPDLRARVQDHLLLVFQLRDAARQRARARPPEWRTE